MANYLHPKNPVGKLYWEKLYSAIGKEKAKKAKITTSNRVWITPNQAVVMETEDGALVAKATLKVMLENEYLSNQTPPRWPKASAEVEAVKNEQTQQLSEQLMKEIIIPAITKDINESPRYAPLRQVYYSLILAEWYKRKVSRKLTVDNPSPYAPYINSGTTAGLESEVPWKKQAIWQEYLKSYQQGEYKLQDTLFGLKRMYFSGGIIIELGNTPTLTSITQKKLLNNPDLAKGLSISKNPNEALVIVNTILEDNKQIASSSMDGQSNDRSLVYEQCSFDFIKDERKKVLDIQAETLFKEMDELQQRINALNIVSDLSKLVCNEDTLIRKIGGILSSFKNLKQKVGASKESLSYERLNNRLKELEELLFERCYFSVLKDLEKERYNEIRYVQKFLTLRLCRESLNLIDSFIKHFPDLSKEERKKYLWNTELQVANVLIRDDLFRGITAKNDIAWIKDMMIKGKFLSVAPPLNNCWLSANYFYSTFRYNDESPRAKLLCILDAFRIYGHVLAEEEYFSESEEEKYSDASGWRSCLEGDLEDILSSLDTKEFYQISSLSKLVSLIKKELKIKKNPLLKLFRKSLFQNDEIKECITEIALYFLRQKKASYP